MKKIKVCIVDDNKELVALLEEYLSSLDDMEVVGVAHNGQDCLKLLSEKKPDVLLLDIIMPHLDGLAVLEKMRELDIPKQLNVIMLTAFACCFVNSVTSTPAIIRPISLIFSSCSSGFTLVFVRPSFVSLEIKRCVSAIAATCGKWVIHNT